jgi:tRNA(adenine34) deaminase
MDKQGYMKLALKEAEAAALQDEVPVGAVAVRGGEVIARAHNQKEREQNATRHAEIVLIDKVSALLNNWYLEDVDFYVTLEPCAMCAGAMNNSRIRALYYGAKDPKSGFADLFDDRRSNHKPHVEGGILEEECGAILTKYFKGKR